MFSMAARCPWCAPLAELSVEYEMAILLLGKSKCGLCGEVIRAEEDACAFPAFGLNNANAMAVFSDGVFHRSCVEADARYYALAELLREWEANTGPGRRKCDECGNQIVTPDDYVFVDWLTEDVAAPLHAFNFTHLHGSCLPRWRRKEEFLAAARGVLASKEWSDSGLDQIVGKIEGA